MVISLDTSQKEERGTRPSNPIIRFYEGCVYYNLGIYPRPIIGDTDVFVNFVSNSPDIDANLNSNDLTITSMNLSASSFQQEWDDEDDNYWNEYL